MLQVCVVTVKLAVVFIYERSRINRAGAPERAGALKRTEHQRGQEHQRGGNLSVGILRCSYCFHSNDYSVQSLCIFKITYSNFTQEGNNHSSPKKILNEKKLPGIIKIGNKQIINKLAAIFLLNFFKIKILFSLEVCDLKADGMYQDPHNCNGFIECFNYETIEWNCPRPDLFFNPVLQKCTNVKSPGCEEEQG